MQQEKNIHEYVGSGFTSRPHPTFAELFTPKLVTILREGYSWVDFRADAIAGLTVAIVALPLSMAIAIGSGLSPDKALYTAIIGGFLISALGGSRFQIGGPAGAFIVLIATIVERQGYDGLVLATFMAGMMMIAVGFLRLGTYIKYIPFPVTVGFTAEIAVIIFASQVKELFGLDIAKEPSALVPKLWAIGENITTVKPATVTLSVLAIGIIVGLRRLRPRWPGLSCRCHRHGRYCRAVQSRRRNHRLTFRRSTSIFANSVTSGLRSHEDRRSSPRRCRYRFAWCD